LSAATLDEHDGDTQREDAVSGILDRWTDHRG
jgi:hypothetical protein